MNRLFTIVVVILMFPILFCVDAAAQGGQPATEKCDGVIYQPKGVSQKARITDKPIPNYPASARLHNISGRVALTAVLCKSGHVTDIQVVKGLSHGLTESAIEAARKVKFEPAQKDGETVSQTMQFEYGFNLDPPGHRVLAREPVEGRHIELIAVIGLVCRTCEKEIWPLIKSRTGGLYHKEQGEQDLKALLALGYFDSKETYLRVEEGERGGLGLAFILKELPTDKPCPKREGP